MTETVATPAARTMHDDRSQAAGVGIAWLFGTTALVGAGLLFMVQPMVAKLVLPSYGGSATVWSTSSLFFQVLLLGGYVYTHLTTTRLDRRIQPRVHLIVLAIPLLTLPVALPSTATPGADVSPALWLLRTLAIMIGLPFLVVSTTGPLLQRWYSWTDGKRADDPYFLFAASNLGSFGGLLAYPFVLEPHLTLQQQRMVWSWGFVAFAVLMAVCGVVASRRRDVSAETVERQASEPVQPVGRRRIAYWTVLAFLPSTLMLAVTAHLSTDVAPIPLLWVVPLAIYLATFVLAFARTGRTAPAGVTRVAAALAVLAIVLAPGTVNLPIALVISVNLALLAVVGYAAHARLAADRPRTEHLTMFYLVIAAGGALGGALNGLVAPAVFDRVWEYPLVLICVPLLLVGLRPYPDNWFTRRYHRTFVTFVYVAVPVGVFQVAGAGLTLGGVTTWLLVPAVIFGIAWALARHPAALAASLALVFAVETAREAGGTLDHIRTFYGSYTVREVDGQRKLVHGNTVHGMQYLDERRSTPTVYYSPDGPLADVFAMGAFPHVSVIGLGTGAIAAWGVEGQQMSFFEIDPEIIQIAQDESLFTYLTDSSADTEVREGDGRLVIKQEPDKSADLIVLDAFNSDSIPVHLLTREAFRIYAEKLSADGVLAVHISNRIFDLGPVLSAAADDLGWHAAELLRSGSRWVVLSPVSTRVDTLVTNEGWTPVGNRDQVHWTDDFSSILDVLR